MDKAEFQKLLLEHAFFLDMPARHIDRMAEVCQRVSFTPGTFIFKEGEEARYFYLILAGHVSLEIYSEHRGSNVLSTLHEGDALGWSWLIPPHIYKFDAVTRDHTEALMLDGRSLREECQADHEFGYELMLRVTGTFVKRLTAARLQLLDLYGGPAR